MDKPQLAQSMFSFMDPMWSADEDRFDAFKELVADVKRSRNNQTDVYSGKGLMKAVRSRIMSILDYQLFIQFLSQCFASGYEVCG